MTTKKPDFFIVGAPKCGTTSLSRYLGQHPEIFIPKLKEPNYFGRDLVTRPKKARMELEDYLNLFENTNKKICGEASTWYLYSQTAAQEIHNFNPNAKIIIMLRNPVDFLHSYHSQCLRTLEEDIQDFKLALEAESERLTGEKTPKNCIRPTALLYSQVVDFAPQVKRYFDVFGRDRVKVILLEDIKKDVTKVYQESLDFLNVHTKFTPEFKLYNPNAKVRNIYLYSLYKEFLWWLSNLGRSLKPIVPFYSFLKKITINLIRNKALEKLFLERSSREPIEIELRRNIYLKFIPQINKLSILIERDLDQWRVD